MLAAARTGDTHSCPLPGHGTTAIETASTNVQVNTRGAARVGDRCGCGAVITTGFASIIVNGRPMAHLGSPTSHGGTIITGSGNTFGGVVFGPPSANATVINFAMLGVFRPDGTLDDEQIASLLADPKFHEKALAANALVDLDGATRQPDPEPVCEHPDMMEVVANYIAGEMNANIHHLSVLKMKTLLSYDVAQETRKQMELPWYAQLGGANPQAIGAANGVAAMAMWTERVGQDRPWDHKPIIRRTIGGIWHKQGMYEYFYDIWSNVHYGYVGMAGGLSESVLLDGAGAEQIISDAIRKVEEVATKSEAEWELPGPNRSANIDGLRAWDDAPDRISIGIGIKLYHRHPHGGITARMIMDEVLAVPSKAWGKGIKLHACK